ncbi:MAG: hypothetical protein ABFS37_13275 [Acidobacteriota bacterium]
MRRRAVASFVVSFLLLPLGVMGADVTGSLLYDGQPLSAVFTDITAAVALASPWSGGEQVEGTVDLGTSTYSFSGLAAVRYGIEIYLDRTAPTNEIWNPGDLSANVSVEPTGSGDSLIQDLDVHFTYRVISPVDSTMPLDGSGQDCSAYPAVAYPITFAIEPVPRATNYTFRAHLNSCPPVFLDLIDVQSTSPSARIDWGTAGEDYQNLFVLCTGAGGTDLCTGPVFEYNDSGVWALLLRNWEGSGRGIHHSDAVVIPAVASAPGAAGTYWSSAVSIANLSASDRQVTVTYTPRGTDGTTSYLDTTVSLPALSAVSWTDIVAELFSTTGAGALEIRGASLAVTSRTSTPGTDDGSYGQGIPPVHPEQILSGSGTATATMAGVEEGTGFRTNLGLCELWGESATVSISIMDQSMSELGNRSYELRPYENIQINRVAAEIAGVTTLANGVVTVAVTSGSGRIGAYISVVDNATGDPTYIVIAPQFPIGG